MKDDYIRTALAMAQSYGSLFQMYEGGNDKHDSNWFKKYTTHKSKTKRRKNKKKR